MNSHVTVSALAQRAYRNFAENTALIASDGKRTTFRELGEIASRVASGFAGLGLTKGDRVVIVAKNRPEYIMAEHACFWGGFLRVTLSYRLHPSEVAVIAADSAARLVLAEPEAIPALRDALAAKGSKAVVAEITSLPQGAPIAAVPAAPDDLVWLPYTSGTTGTPKGVMHSNLTYLAGIRNAMVELPPTTPDDRVLHLAPLSHLSGFIGLGAILRGAAQLFMADLDAKGALEIIAKHKVTMLPAVPVIIRLLTQAAENAKYDLSSLHTVIYAGSAISAENLGRAVKTFGSIFIQMYGLTEFPMPITCLQKADHHEPQLAAAGRVVPFVEVEIDAPEGEAGEILVRSDMAMLGYLNQPEASAEMFRADGFGRTGDVGRMENGFLFIVDRKKDMIVSGGFNIFPNEVERAISTVAGVEEVVVIGVPSKEWGEEVLALVVRSAGSDVTEDHIREACRNSIASYKKPRGITFVTEFPRNSTGKILRRELREKYWGDRTRRVDG